MKRMTANPVKPARYRPGKPIAEEPSSEEEQDEEVETTPGATPSPQVTSLPSDATKIASNLKQVDLNERKRKAALEEAERLKAERAARAKEEDGFVTEESGEEERTDDDEDDAEESGSGSGSEESTSEEEAPKIHLRPTFIKKGKRKEGAIAATSKTEDELWAEEEVRRKAKADAMIQEQLEKNAAAQAAGKKNWDDDEDEEADQVDDTDGLDPETERASWKLRELKRVKREREAIETAEKERDEIERRRNLSREEREAEDQEFLDRQKSERENKGKMGYMQKYFHKGAFFQDDAKAEGLDRRDIMGSRYQDDVANRELLPEYMQIRDMAKLGRKGRTKYKDLKSEDTGRWGVGVAADDARKRSLRPDAGVRDERFMPDRPNRAAGANTKETTGANSTAILPRPPPSTTMTTTITTTVTNTTKSPEGAPQGPSAATDPTGSDSLSLSQPTRTEANERTSHPPRRESPHSKNPSHSHPYPHPLSHAHRSRNDHDTYRPSRASKNDNNNNNNNDHDQPGGRFADEPRRHRRRSYSRSRSRSRRRRRGREEEDVGDYGRGRKDQGDYGRGRDEEYERGGKRRESEDRQQRRKRSRSPYRDRDRRGHDRDSRDVDGDGEGNGQSKKRRIEVV